MDGIYGSSVTGRRKTIQVGSLDGNESQVEAFKSTRTHVFPSTVKNEGREDRGRKAWHTLHTAKDWTESDLLAWEETIPGYECGGGCKKFYNEWKAANPPDYKDLFSWGFRLHNAVNSKLNKPVIALEEAEQIWQHARNSPSS